MYTKYGGIMKSKWTAFLILFGMISFSNSQTQWIKYSENPVLEPSVSSWDSLTVYLSDVILYNNQYKMWYSGFDGTSSQLGYAYSADGINWTKHDTINPLIPLGPAGSWDEKHVYGSSTIIVNNQYKMYYSGIKPDQYQIGLATSDDGINWQKYSGNPVLSNGSSGAWDDKVVYIPSVVYDGTTYHMWYSGHSLANNYLKIGYAYSSDGVTWTKHPTPVLEGGASGSWDESAAYWADVMFENGLFEMWYTGQTGSTWAIGYATSTDGINWTKFADNPILEQGNVGEWDYQRVQHPYVIKQNNVYKMWYSGMDNDANNTQRIGYATSYIPPGLVAYYPFNGNANDESGNGNDGTLLPSDPDNCPQQTSDRFGNPNSAYYFDGVDDIINFQDSTNLDGFSEATISLWIKPGIDMNSSTGRQDIVYKGEPAQYTLNYDSHDGMLTATFNNAYHSIDYATEFFEDQWYHISLVYDGTPTLVLYVDGISVGTGDNQVSPVIPDNTDPLTIGATDEPLYHFNGTIDDIHIYNRASPESEIDSLYRQNMIEIGMGSFDATLGDTILVPVTVTLPPDSLYRAAELNFDGYQAGLDFIEIDTAGSMIGGLDWILAVNETDTLLFTAQAGTDNISGSGTFCFLKFVVTGEICTTIPVECVYAKFNSNPFTDITNGGVYINPITEYGDVDENGVVEALDASDVLEHVIAIDTLGCQGLANADVTNDGTISALDASVILQYVVHLIDSLPYTEPLLAEGSMSFIDGVILPGATVELPLLLSNGSNILSFEGELVYNPDHLSFASIEWSSLLSGFTINTRTKEGTIDFAGASANPDGQEGVFATVHFTVNSSFSEDETQVVLDKMRLNEGPITGDVATATLTLSADSDELGIPDRFALHQNYPNPFNPTTQLRYDLPEQAFVQLAIYDLLGRQVITLVNRVEEAGYRSVTWNGTDTIGKAVSAGMYLYVIKAGDYMQTKKMILLK